jgi:Apea-like HEPN
MKKAGEIKKLFDAFIQKLPSPEEMAEARRARKSGPLDRLPLIRGSLLLEGQLAAEYARLAEEADRVARDEGTWSKSALDDLLAECTREVLAAPADARAGAARTQGRRLLEALKSPLADWVVDLEVVGCKHDMNGVKFGEVEFLVDQTKRDLLLKAVKGGAGTFATVVLARVSVTAIDRDSAELSAGRKIDEHLAVLTALCSDGIPSLIHLHRGEDKTGTRISLRRIRKLSETEFLHGTHSNLTGRLLPRAEFDEALRVRGGRRVADLMTSRTEFGKRLVAAYVTAGSASVEEKPFLAFLLYAVALESAVLGGRNKTEITFQLSARVAHLLGGTLKARENFAAKMKKLYVVRSDIAHSGSREITTADLEEMRVMCLASLHALTVLPELENAKTEKDLESWFQRKLLGGA